MWRMQRKILRTTSQTVEMLVDRHVHVVRTNLRHQHFLASGFDSSYVEALGTKVWNRTWDKTYRCWSPRHPFPKVKLTRGIITTASGILLPDQAQVD